MGKIADFFKRKSIKAAFTTSMLVCIISALLLSLVLSNVCQWGRSKYYEKYQLQFVVSDPEMMIGFDRTDDERKGSITYQTTRNLKDHFTATERTIYNMLACAVAPQQTEHALLDGKIHIKKRLLLSVKFI